MKIGDQAGVRVLAALSAGGAPWWCALRVAAGHEARVRRWLEYRGVTAFYPVTQRRAVRCGKLRVWEAVYLPGLVFACFRGAPIAHRVRACAGVVGAIQTSGGAWARLVPADLVALHRMRQRGEDLDAESRARALAARLVRPGEGALFRAGPLAGQHCEVVTLAGTGRARVRLRLFGADHEAEADISDLVPVRRTA